VRQLIRGYTDGVIEETHLDELTTTASELAAVRDLIIGSEDLKTVLSDPGVPASSRRAVLDELLSSRVGKTTLKLLDFAVEQDRATELADDLNWLVERIAAAGNKQRPQSDVVLGRKTAEERVDGFATALLDKGEADERLLSRIEDELFVLLQAIGANDELRSILTSRDVPADARAALVRDLIARKAHPISTSLAIYATHVGRPRDYEDLLEFLVERAARASQRRLAEVRSVVSMDDRQRSDLAQALARVVGHNVDVRVTLDPSLLAGFVATVGDTVVDGSARHRLELLKERLVMPEVKVTTGERN
jgi:F-type H+-transporting ATPase subunit delta